MFAWLVANPRLILAGVCAAALLGLLGWERHQGAEGVRKADRKAVAAAVADNTRREAAATAVSADVGGKLDAEKVRIEYRTRTLIEKVPTYVPQAADDRCIVNRGFVLQHDLAAHPETALPTAPGGSLEAPSGVELSAVAATVVANYGAAYEWRAEALAWRDWYARQAADWEKH